VVTNVLLTVTITNPNILLAVPYLTPNSLISALHRIPHYTCTCCPILIYKTPSIHHPKRSFGAVELSCIHALHVYIHFHFHFQRPSSTVYNGHIVKTDICNTPCHTVAITSENYLVRLIYHRNHIRKITTTLLFINIRQHSTHAAENPPKITIGLRVE